MDIKFKCNLSSIRSSMNEIFFQVLRNKEEDSVLLENEYELKNVNIQKTFPIPNNLNEFKEKFKTLNFLNIDDLKKYKAIIAGGSVSNVFTNTSKLTSGSDIDIFMYDQTPTNLFKLLERITTVYKNNIITKWDVATKFQKGEWLPSDDTYDHVFNPKNYDILNYDKELFNYVFGDKIQMKGHVINIYLTWESTITKLQIVLYKFKSIADILNNFDMSCCQYGFDGKDVYMLESSYISLFTRYNFIFSFNQKRIYKYEKRGFITLETKEQICFEKCLKEILSKTPKQKPQKPQKEEEFDLLED